MARISSKNSESALRARGAHKYDPRRAFMLNETQASQGYTTSEPISQGTEITIGHMYTKNAAGYIVPPAIGDKAAKFLRGRFQATKTWTNSKFPFKMPAASADTTDGHRNMEFRGVGSFIVMYTEADVMSGELVDLATQDCVKPNATGIMNASTVGTCCDIRESIKNRLDEYSHRGRTRKPKSAKGDLALVRMAI